MILRENNIHIKTFLTDSLVRTDEVMELDYYQPECNLFLHYRYYLIMLKIISQVSCFFSRKCRRAALHFIKKENGIRTRNNTTTPHTQTHTNIPDDDHKPHYHGPEPTPPLGDHNDQQLHDFTGAAWSHRKRSGKGGCRGLMASMLPRARRLLHHC
jgi:hypothetical protein